ncbi:MAG: hypothetical protein J3R72DRAFT_526188 [Linnemannia gamsii]|nr:MAG: hypothetical protein J3R72DRAFT_526188 [Linnemannia gamsii]
MHFSTIIASASILVLAASVATVSAQQVAVAEACTLCFTKAALAASPTCTFPILYSETLPSAMSPAEKACLCPLISSFTWFQSCSSPDACTTDEMKYFTQYYVGDEAVICSGVSTPSPAPGATTSSAHGTKTSSSPAPPGASATPGAGVGTGTPETPKSDAVALYGSYKVLVGAALGIASAVVLLL